MVSASEVALIERLEGQLAGFAAPNREHESYYDGSFAAKLLNISTPSEIANILRNVSGWAGTAVDVLEERLDLLGFADDELLATFTDNALDEESSQVHLDAMIYGVGFVSVTAGGDNEPEFLIRGHDAKNTTGIFNARTRRLDAAYTRQVVDGEVLTSQLWLPDRMIEFKRDSEKDQWRVDREVAHGVGVVPMVPFVNRPRTGARGGKSEITAPLRRYADSAVRTLLAMDVNREFFSAPQRYAIGLSEQDFVGPNGVRKSPWQVVTGRLWTTGELNEGDVPPTLGEFAPQPAGPFLEQIEGLAQLAAAEAGVPAHYFGLRGVQATSADAIRAMEARLVKKAERRMKSFGRGWSEVGRLVRAAQSGGTIFEVDSAGVRWGDPATPTVAATADAMVKYVQAGIVPGNSQPVWDRAGFTPDEQREMRNALAQNSLNSQMAMLSAGGVAAQVGRALSPESTGDRMVADGGLSGG